MLDNQWGFLLWLEEKPNVPEGSVHAKNQRSVTSAVSVLACMQNQIARSCSIGQATVHRYLERGCGGGSELAAAGRLGRSPAE